MSEPDAWAPNCALKLVVVIAALFVAVWLCGCASMPASWPHFADPWPVDEPLHDGQAPLCPDSCTI